MLRKLWDDEVGAVVSMEIVVIASVLVIAMVAGWAVLRGVIFVELSNQAEWIAGEGHETHIDDFHHDDPTYCQIIICNVSTCEDAFNSNG